MNIKFFYIMTNQTTEIKKEFKLLSSPPFPSSNQAPHLKVSDHRKMDSHDWMWYHGFGFLKMM